MTVHFAFNIRGASQGHFRRKGRPRFEFKKFEANLDRSPSKWSRRKTASSSETSGIKRCDFFCCIFVLNPSPSSCLSSRQSDGSRLSSLLPFVPLHPAATPPHPIAQPPTLKKVLPLPLFLRSRLLSAYIHAVLWVIHGKPSANVRSFLFG